MTDAPNRFLVNALVDELQQTVVAIMHFQGTVAGLDEIGRRPDDRPQGGVQLQAGRNHQHRLDQPVEAVTALDDLLNTVLHLDQEFAKTQL